MRLPLIVGWAVLAALLAPEVHAANENQPMHWSGDNTVWDRKRNIIELTGHASVTQPGETLVADYIKLDLNDRTVLAKGNALYTTNEAVVQGDEVYFNLDTRTGSVVRGRVTNESFSLMGERINKLGPGRFQTERGEYTTCRDCPNSWSLLGEDVDLTFGGYAYMTNVSVKIKDTPIFWTPYLIVPVKSRRETGFLPPRMGVSGQNGFTFVEPFFWAIGQSADMTFGLGTYTAKGRRLEWEGRYALSQRSTGTANFYSQADRMSSAPRLSRWAAKVTETQEAPLGIDQKIRYREVSDNRYPIDFPEDIPGLGDIVLSSDMILSHSSRDVSSYIAVRRYRNLLNLNSLVDFDPNTVQQMPYALVTTNDRPLFGTPVAAGLSLGIANFTRASGAVDYDATSTPGQPYRLGVDPVRKATRASITPSLYTTLHPFGVLSLIPSLQYRGYFYTFPIQSGMPNLSRGYLVFQTELSAQWERIYETDNPEQPRIKHLIRPVITYSRIPFVNEPNHPFTQQVKYNANYEFDSNDVVPNEQSPSTVDYFTPLGNSISFGGVTQIVIRKGRLGNDDAGYKRTVEFTAGDTLNLVELQKSANTRIPLTRIYSTLNLDFEKFSSQLLYYYYPYLGHILSQRQGTALPSGPVSPHAGSVSFSYYMEKTMRERVLAFERSLTASYSFSRIDSSVSNLTAGLVYSINDYLLPSAAISYDFLTHHFFSTTFDFSFQSPSECWKFVTSVDRYIGRPGWDIHFDVSLNLTGNSFNGVTGSASRGGS